MHPRGKDVAVDLTGQFDEPGLEIEFLGLPTKDRTDRQEYSDRQSWARIGKPEAEGWCWPRQHFTGY